MRPVDEWLQILAWILLSNIVAPTSYKEIRRQVSSHFDTNLDVALEQMEHDGLIVFQRMVGEVHYQIADGKIDDMQRLANKEPNAPEQVEVVQPFTPDPPGFTYWFEIVEIRTLKKQSIYRIYHKQNDSLCFFAHVVGRSSRDRRAFDMGSLNDPKSRISMCWRHINELAKENGAGTFFLQELFLKNMKYHKNNSRQLEKVALAIFKELGWIEIVSFQRNSARYQITGKNAATKRMDDFLYPENSAINDPETLDSFESELDKMTGGNDHPDDDTLGGTA